MMQATANTITPLEAWVIKRIVTQLEVGDLMDYGISDPVFYLAIDLQRTPIEKRGQLLNERLSKTAMYEVVRVDPNKPAPEVAPIEENSRWEIIHVNDLKHLPKSRYLIEPFIVEGGLSVLYGPSGAFKSFSALDMSLQVAQSHPVIYVIYEGRLGYRQRVEAWCSHHRRTAGQLYLVVGQLSVMEDSELNRFIEKATKINPVLVVIDTVARAMTGSDENSTRDMGLFVSHCEWVQSTLKSAVMVVHHTSKQGIQERGSGALRGAADIMIKQTMDDSTIVIECEKSKDAEPFDTIYREPLPVEVEIDNEILSVPVLIDANNIIYTGDRLTKNQRKILEALNMDVFLEGATVSELTDLLPEIAKSSMMRVLSRLLQLALISQSDKRQPYMLTEGGKSRLSRLSQYSTEV